MMKIIDLHCDTIMHLYQGKHLKRMEDSHVDLEKLQRGGCMAQCFAIFVPTGPTAERMKLQDTPEEYFEKAYRAYQRELALNRDIIAPACSTADILANAAAGKMSAILTVEDGVTLRGKLENVEEYYRRGVRMVALTWNYENSLGYPQSTDPERHARGLKPFGIEAVRRMNELGIAVDVSHLSEGGFWDVVRHSSKPFIASHSCCRAMQNIPRNLSDDQICAIGESGGIIGINFANDFLHPVADRRYDRLTAVTEVVRHLDHMSRLAGMDAVAIGSDHDGISSELEWGDYGGMPLLVEGIVKKFGSYNAEKICSGNALRALRDIIG